jgi:hypothetical protein
MTAESAESCARRRDCTSVTPMIEMALGATPRAPLTAPMSTLLTSRGSVERVRGAAPGAAGRVSETPMAAGEALGTGEVDGVALWEAPEGRALGEGVRVRLVVVVAERLARAVGDGKVVRVGDGVLLLLVSVEGGGVEGLAPALSVVVGVGVPLLLVSEEKGGVEGLAPALRVGVGERVAEADPGAVSTAAATATGGGLLAACAAMAATLVLVPADICARRVVAARWRSNGESSLSLVPGLRRVAAFFLQLQVCMCV